MKTKPLAHLILAAAVTGSLGASAVLVADRAPARPRTQSLAAAPGAAIAPVRADDAVTAEDAAVAFAGLTLGVPIRDGDVNDTGRYCAPDRLRVQWSPPAAGTTYGAHIEPLGPRPGRDTAAVNGIVVCEGSSYAYMGFEALRTGNDWQIIPVPDVQDNAETPDEHEKHGDTIDPGLVPKATPPSAAKTGPIPSRAKLTAAIESYAGYDAQDTCSASAKPGVLAFRKLVLSQNPKTRSMGITRACSAGGRSEHKEGRAWDWGARMDRPAERDAAQALIDWLFATDQYGNEHAMARRLGIMYIVWNRQIWGAYRADQGWRSYSGSNPHTDHVHFSFAWPGADGKTSFWTGVPATMPGANGGGGSWRPAGDGKGIRDASTRKKDGTEWRRRDDGGHRWTQEEIDAWKARRREMREQREQREQQYRDRWRRDHSPTPQPSPATEEPSEQPEPKATSPATPSASPSPSSSSSSVESSKTRTETRRKRQPRKKRTRKPRRSRSSR